MNRRCLILFVLAATLAITAALAGPAAALMHNGAHGWYWQMPQPGEMAGVAFSGDKDVWSAGGGGGLLHSTDGGLTWAEQPTGTGADLWIVQFVDGLHGFAAGASAVISTADGGATWKDMTPPAALADEYWDMSFGDALHGWVTTTDGAVLRTTDGGVTWTRKSLGSGVGEVACDYVDATHGWAIADGGRVWKTADGGATWTRPAGAIDPASQWGVVDFWDARHGWIWGYSQRQEDVFLLYTADGGAHWRPSVGASWISDLVPVSPSEAWTIESGDALWLESTVVGHTTDGGRHWATTPLSMPAAPYSIGTRGDDICAVGDGVIVSGDAGRSWLPASSGQAYGIAGIDAVAADDLWAVESGGALLHSTDGVRWAEQAVPERWSSSLLALDFVDAKTGWVVGTSDLYGESGLILHTADGGATWAPQTSNLGGRLVGVDFIDATTGWAISDSPYWSETGANTAIERTTDGGQTWVPLYVGNGVALSAVQFFDASNGWAAGKYGANDGDGTPALFSTANGGFTWTRHALPGGAAEMSGLQFIDATNGWAVGVDYDWQNDTETGWALRTTDGGTTWTRVDALSDALPVAVHFIDAGHGYVSGDNGVWATTDGGSTWGRVADGPGATSVAATDTSHVWVGGYGFLTSTLDGAGDSAAPTTLHSGSLVTWARKPASIRLVANDIGGSGLAGTAYRIDGDAAWQAGTTVKIPAPADHSNDGEHSVYYRSTDNAGNAEQLEILGVGIDTLGPTCSVYKPSTVNAGGRGILYFKVQDATSGVAHATITARDRRGRAVLHIRLGRGHWGMSPAPRYYWWRFSCKLKPGAYRLEVRAVDAAGNAQIAVGRGKLKVVKSGAPAQRHPDWPAGLPFASSGYGARQGAVLPPVWRPALASVERAAALPESVRWARLLRAAR